VNRTERSNCGPTASFYGLHHRNLLGTETARGEAKGEEKKLNFSEGGGKCGKEGYRDVLDLTALKVSIPIMMSRAACGKGRVVGRGRSSSRG